MSTAPALGESPPVPLSASPASPTVLHLCTGCFRELPTDCFRIRYRATGERHKTCKDCFNKYRTTKRKPRLKRKRLSMSITALAGRDNRTNIRMPALIARRMIRHFGGLDRTCELWAQEVKSLMARRPGSRMSIKTFQALMHILAVTETAERDDAQANVAKMSTAELAGVFEWLAEQAPTGS